MSKNAKGEDYTIALDWAYSGLTDAGEIDRCVDHLLSFPKFTKGIAEHLKQGVEAHEVFEGSLPKTWPVTVAIWARFGINKTASLKGSPQDA